MGLVGRELADVAERVEVMLGDDEQVHGCLRVDVPDRNETLGRGDVVALAEEPAEQAVVTRRAAKDPLLRHGVGPHADELADGRVDEKRRVVVAVSLARTVDENDVVRAELRLPAAPLELTGERAQPGAALLLLARSARGRQQRSSCPAAASTGRRGSG